MRYFYIFLCVFVLIGAGCSNEVQDTVILNGEEVRLDALNQDLNEAEGALDDALTEDDAEAGDADQEETVATEEVAVDDSVEEPVQEEPEEVAEPEEEEPVEEVVLDPVTYSMNAGNFFFAPAALTAAPGQEVRLLFEDVDGVHTLVIDEIGFKTSVTNGGSASFIAPSEPGSYTFYCDIGSHRAFGQEGVLTIAE